MRDHHRHEFRHALAEGTPDQVRANPAVIEAYLGKRRSMLLEIRNVHVHYHKVAALKGIDMAVPDDGIVTIIGANGAGKSTTLRAISGLVPISKGEIVFAGKRIDRLPPEKIVALGIAHVPEGRRVFPNLTVEENLRTGAFLRTDKAEIDKDLDEVFRSFPAPEGAPQAMGAIAFRGRAADARYRPGADVAAEDARSRRAIDGSVAGHGAGDRAHHSRDRRARRRRSCWSSRTPSWRSGWRASPMCWRPDVLRCKGPAHELHDNEHVRRAYLGG